MPAVVISVVGVACLLAAFYVYARRRRVAKSSIIVGEQAVNPFTNFSASVRTGKDEEGLGMSLGQPTGNGPLSPGASHLPSYEDALLQPAV